MKMAVDRGDLSGPWERKAGGSRTMKGGQMKFSPVTAQCELSLIFPKKPSVLLGYGVEFIWRMGQKSAFCFSRCTRAEDRNCLSGSHPSQMQAAGGQLLAN